MEKKLRFYRAVEWIAVLLGGINIVFPVLIWNRIPERIPSHFNAAGIADDWSGKSSLISVGVSICLLTVLMSVAVRYQRAGAVSPSATEAEKRRAPYIYPVLTMTHLFLQLIFGYITFCSITRRNLGRGFLPAVLFFVLGFSAFCIFRYAKGQKAAVPPQNVAEQPGLKDKSLRQYYREAEASAKGECYRSKIDLWLGILLVFVLFLPVFFFIREWMQTGTWSLSNGLILLLMLVIFVPVFRTRYLLYPEHITIVCFGKLRIPYEKITGIKETHNPLSSAALSLDRLQIDYVNRRGYPELTLISPVRKQEFIRKVSERSHLSPPEV